MLSSSIIFVLFGTIAVVVYRFVVTKSSTSLPKGVKELPGPRGKFSQMLAVFDCRPAPSEERSSYPTPLTSRI